MENASKALIMAASILLGVMIISIAVYLFSVFGQYSADTYKKMEETKIAEFNSQFLKYSGNVECTAHDIISVANLAMQNNLEYELTEYNESTYYIQVDVESTKKLEARSEEYRINFIKENSTKTSDEETQIKYYKCVEARISEITGRICYMKFMEQD